MDLRVVIQNFSRLSSNVESRHQRAQERSEKRAAIRKQRKESGEKRAERRGQICTCAPRSMGLRVVIQKPSRLSSNVHLV
jgi:hypothetical protein